jgi:hypothetical protein
MGGDTGLTNEVLAMVDRAEEGVLVLTTTPILSGRFLFPSTLSRAL